MYENVHIKPAIRFHGFRNKRLPAGGYTDIRLNENGPSAFADNPFVCGSFLALPDGSQVRAYEDCAFDEELMTDFPSDPLGRARDYGNACLQPHYGWRLGNLMERWQYDFQNAKTYC
jgi:hypothetical protein